MRLTALFGLALLAVACAPKAEAPETQDAAAPLSAAALDSVKAVDAAFASAMNAGDSAAVAAAYADDATLMPPDAPGMQGAALQAFIGGFMAAKPSDFVLRPTVAYGVGDLAYMVGTATFKLGGVADSVKYTEVLRRGGDGKWRYLVDMFSGMAPPAAAATHK
ncbi:MAG: DUF4440 domain-containing protein [Gemmatimonadota bacterium]